MEKDIANKVIAVTGGAEGIGFQIIRYFLIAEAKLAILLDINEETGNRALETLTTEFGANKVVFIKCNVLKDLEEVYQKIYERFGVIDVLVNNAGLVNEEVPEICIDINLTATIKWSLKFMEVMTKDINGKGGTIMNIASIFGYRASPYAPVYNASKHGVAGFTKSLGHERMYKAKHVRVFAICPGFVRTSLTKEIHEGDDEICTEIKANYKWQSAEEVAEKTVEAFRLADSGTLWEIEGGVLREVK